MSNMMRGASSGEAGLRKALQGHRKQVSFPSTDSRGNEEVGSFDEQRYCFWLTAGKWVIAGKWVDSNASEQRSHHASRVRSNLEMINEEEAHYK